MNQRNETDENREMASRAADVGWSGVGVCVGERAMGARGLSVEGGMECDLPAHRCVAVEFERVGGERCGEPDRGDLDVGSGGAGAAIY